MVHNSRVKLVQSAITIGYHSGIAGTVRGGLTTLVSWIAPGAKTGVGALIAACAAGALIYGLRASRRERAAKESERGVDLTHAGLTLLACYLVVLILSRL